MQRHQKPRPGLFPNINNARLEMPAAAKALSCRAFLPIDKI
jgi:hypothetical protein